MTGLIGRMREATLLTRAGKLGEATSFIQRLLNGDLPDAPEQKAHDGLVIEHEAEAPAGPSQAPGRFVDGVFSDPAGSRPYKLFIPGGASDRSLPLVVMLHGCTQGPDDFAAGTRMNALAQERGFLALYPAQVSSANPQRCWNWFNEADQRRGSGEPAILSGMTRAIMAEHRVDPGRVFAAGLSAGGAAAAILGAAYPDLYAAVGVHSGLAAGSANGISSALTAMRRGHAGQAFAGGSARVVPAIVFHGTRDATVNPLNADEIVAQARAAAPLDAAVERGEQGGRAFMRTVFSDASGRPVVEQWSVEGLGHAWSGGSAAGSYADPAGPDASAEFLRFFMAAAV